MGRSRLFTSIAIAGAAAAFALTSVSEASAAPVLKPSPSCKVPVLSVSRTTAEPGTRVTVSGVNFSGCSAQGSTAKPTPVLTVQVGVVTAAKVTEVLATTKTTASGAFSVQITVPKVSAGGKPKIALAAVAEDPATKLSYEGVAAITYAVAPTTTPSSPASSSPAAPSSATDTSPAAPSSTSSVDVPTAVPAGSGGFGAPTSPVEVGAEITLAAAGIALIALGGVGLARRRSRQH